MLDPPFILGLPYCSIRCRDLIVDNHILTFSSKQLPLFSSTGFYRDYSHPSDLDHLISKYHTLALLQSLFILEEIQKTLNELGEQDSQEQTDQKSGALVNIEIDKRSYCRSVLFSLAEAFLKPSTQKTMQHVFEGMAGINQVASLLGVVVTSSAADLVNSFAAVCSLASKEKKIKDCWILRKLTALFGMTLGIKAPPINCLANSEMFFGISILASQPKVGKMLLCELNYEAENTKITIRKFFTSIATSFPRVDQLNSLIQNQLGFSVSLGCQSEGIKLEPLSSFNSEEFVQMGNKIIGITQLSKDSRSNRSGVSVILKFTFPKNTKLVQSGGVKPGFSITNLEKSELFFEVDVEEQLQVVLNKLTTFVEKTVSFSQTDFLIHSKQRKSKIVELITAFDPMQSKKVYLLEEICSIVFYSGAISVIADLKSKLNQKNLSVSEEEKLLVSAESLANKLTFSQFREPTSISLDLDISWTELVASHADKSSTMARTLNQIIPTKRPTYLLMDMSRSKFKNLPAPILYQVPDIWKLEDGQRYRISSINTKAFESNSVIVNTEKFDTFSATETFMVTQVGKEPVEKRLSDIAPIATFILYELVTSSNSD